MGLGKGDDLRTPAVEEGIGGDKDCGGLASQETLERGFNLLRGTRLRDN
jgi:hypothetical protein